ncbi:MAG TPA: response regulator transcription factor [Bradyrhizobium sp.]|uniref:response regulator transcription factor n=1 Tax=Bradyrhizobium sp. TaxID=376 RepID=UPI002BBEF964|nr:response regulator transcription factor [Bradyrhizobium sp.]HLZ06831.1 response regulator transcription factor [Bradyrhizobium sp.]
MTAAGGTIMLVDDHAVVREGYRSVLQKQPGLKVIAEASDGAEAYRRFKEVKPDLVIMDLAMPGIGGIEAIRRIRQWDRTARVLVFTMHQNAGFALQAIRAGARGYVTKTSPPETLVRAAMDVLAGRMAISPDIDHQLALGRLAGETLAADVLTPREFEVFRMLLAERTTQDIAEELHLSPRTVANLHSLIKDKLGVGSDIELVRLALRQGILSQADVGEASRAE